MNGEEQRIAIAEACGWRKSRIGSSWKNPQGQQGFTSIPDYTNDLNAIHEAEKQFLPKCPGDRRFDEYDEYLRIIMQRTEPVYSTTHATATQRAEAFLKTLGLWRE